MVKGRLVTTGARRIPGSWVEKAVCQQVGVETFFPPDDKPVARDFYAKAKAVCVRCPVINECLNYGIDETYGVWGGTTPTERAALRGKSQSQ